MIKCYIDAENTFLNDRKLSIVYSHEEKTHTQLRTAELNSYNS